MKMLSIRQPWAHLIIKGIKDVENRPWERDYRGPLLVHAGQARGFDQRDLITEMIDEGHIKPSETLHFGGIIGVVNLVDIVDNSRSAWADDESLHWVLKRPRRVPFVRMKAQLGLLDVKWPQAASGPRVVASCSFKARDLAFEDEPIEEVAVATARADLGDTDRVVTVLRDVAVASSVIAEEGMLLRAARALGYQRVTAPLRSALRTAVRRGALKRDRLGNLRPGRKPR